MLVFLNNIAPPFLKGWQHSRLNVCVANFMTRTTQCISKLRNIWLEVSSMVNGPYNFQYHAPKAFNRPKMTQKLPKTAPDRQKRPENSRTL